MGTLVRWATVLMQAGEMSLNQTKKWAEWAAEDPKAAAIAARSIAGFAEHRAYLLRNRRVWFRKSQRLARLDSLHKEMTGLAEHLEGLPTSL